VSDTLEVSLLPDVPVLDLGADISLCPGESQTLTINAPGTDILWNDGSTDTSFQVTSGGLVYATISNACGESSDTVQVEMLDSVPALDLGGDQSLCPGETITIDPGISGVEYLWQDGSTSPTYQATSPGWIVLTVWNDCGSATDSLQIILDPNGPQVDLGPDILACEGDTVILNAGISGVEYLWQDGSVAAQFIVTQSGIYYVQVSNACGTDSDTVQVQVQGTGPVPSLGPDTVLCEGEVLTLVADADSLTSIQWQDGSTTQQYVVTEPGTYILSETNHCGSSSDTIVIEFESAPEPFDLGEDRIICPGDTVVLSAPQTATLITWQDGSHVESFIAVDEQIYTLELSNNCGAVSDEIAISFDPNEPQVNLNPASLCDGESVVLDATQPFDAEYLWSTGSTSSVIQVTTPGNYFVSVMTECYFTDGSVLVVAADDSCNPHIYVPNVFSPNGDQVNDRWEIHIDPDLQFTAINCKIYDRWGDLVFSSTDIPVVWDGNFGGKEVAPGVFVYLVRIQDESGRTRTMSGDITLIR
jgi:gliding motility-associated-like protein